ncbi:MAG: ATP-binding protein [Gemmatimonadota bacterium]
MGVAVRQASEEMASTSIVESYDAIGVGIQRTHAVQFYDDDEFLVNAVGDFLASGLAQGQPVIAVATLEHLAGFREHLETRGFDVDRAIFRGQLGLQDAAEMLAAFMDGAHPNPERCRVTVGAILRQFSSNLSTSAVRVYGEMVDVLCRAGNVQGALELEEIWNELAQTYRFSLLCGYSMRTFAEGTQTASVQSICGTHAHVIPTERYVGASTSERLREIAILQQRAQALETELERRNVLERSLRVALERAESANRAKNQFLAVMSHELRTPLNAIGGHVQLIDMELLGPVSEKQHEALARVQKSQRHLLGLINEVLNLARLESSQVRYEVETLSVDTLVAEVTALLEPLFSAGGLTCDVECAPANTPILSHADREKVHQILLNVLGNANKFTPPGGRIRVRVTRGTTLDRPISIAISDSGIGIPEDKLGMIFEPFVQINGHAPREGVGLGLSISRILARGMGGDLVADSVLGVGSTFTLTLQPA